MQLIGRTINVRSMREEVRIVAMGCLHWGAAGCDEGLIDFWLRYILKRPNTYVIFGGDLVDSIHEKDKRYAEEEVADWCTGTKANRGRWGGTLIDRQFRYALNKMRPLADKGKILWIHSGNHEEKLVSTASRNLTMDWARSLGVPYAGLAALSNLYINGAGRVQGSMTGNGYRVTFFTHHGGGGAQTDGGVINAATSMLSGYDVDVSLMWHLHKKGHMTKRMLTINKAGKRQVRDRVAAVCGTFLDGHVEGLNSYAELKGYKPTVTGPMVVHLKRETMRQIDNDPMRASGYTRIWISDAVTDRER